SSDFPFRVHALFSIAQTSSINDGAHNTHDEFRGSGAVSLLKTAAALRRKRQDTGRRAAPARSPERAKQGAPRRKKKLTYKSSVRSEEERRVGKESRSRWRPDRREER